MDFDVIRISAIAVAGCAQFIFTRGVPACSAPLITLHTQEEDMERIYSWASDDIDMFEVSASAGVASHTVEAVPQANQLDKITGAVATRPQTLLVRCNNQDV